MDTPLVLERSVVAPTQAATTRVESVDLLRGLVIVLMALDHVRDYFGRLPNPEDLSVTTPALFATRWLTHFCAPVFSVLAGVGASLQLSRGTSTREVSAYLLKRGLFLIVLELTFMQTMWSAARFPLGLVTLWALGVSMVALAGLIFLPRPWVLAVSVLIVAGHNLLDGIHGAALGAWQVPWSIFHESYRDQYLLVMYPVGPWIGVMALGFCLGPVLLWPGEARRRFLVRAGVGCLALFVALRALNVYGDLEPWSPQATTLQTVLSFLKVTKYPPSLDFVLVTLGPAALALAWLDRVHLGAANPLLVFGRSPLFFYLAHAALLPVLVFTRYALAGQPRWAHIEEGLGELGVGLPGVYLVWLAVVVALFWPTVAFGRAKRAHPEFTWLKYL